MNYGFGGYPMPRYQQDSCCGPNCDPFYSPYDAPFFPPQKMGGMFDDRSFPGRQMGMDAHMFNDKRGKNHSKGHNHKDRDFDRRDKDFGRRGRDFDGRDQFYDGRDQFYDGRDQFYDGRNQYHDGRDQYHDGRDQYHDGRGQWMAPYERDPMTNQSGGNWKSRNQAGSDTYDRAQRLLEDLHTQNESALSLDESDKLLEGKYDFDHLFRGWGGDGEMRVGGTSYQSSTIYKDGKAVTVTKRSKLHPDGTIRTEVVQEFEKDGHRDSRTWAKEDNAFRYGIEGERREQPKELSSEQKTFKPEAKVDQKAL